MHKYWREYARERKELCGIRSMSEESDRSEV
jgi:hypothetical protein